MTTITRSWLMAGVTLAIGLAIPTGLAGQGAGMGRMGMGGDQVMAADMAVYRQLLDRWDKITRTVTRRADGVVSVTESEDPAVVTLIQNHVGAMAARVDEARPIHLRDPLFAEVFKHASQIVMKAEQTSKGVRVVETSTDPYVVKLIQAHADVVSLFLANGHAEVMKNHAIPDRSR